MRKCICFLLALFSFVFLHAQIGALDPAFGTGGVVITPVGSGSDEVRSIAVQSNGKVVVVGYSFNGTDFDFAVARYNVDGTADNSFGGGDGIVTTDISAADDDAFAVAIQTDQKIVVAGVAGSGNNDFAVVRYNTDGTPDSTFSGDGIATTDITSLSDDHAASVAIQTDGKIVLAGFRNQGNNGDFALVRYNTNGTPDSSFDGDGIVITDLNGLAEDFASAVVIQNDGKIVASGSTGGGSVYDLAVARYNTNGTLDNTFGGGDGIAITSAGGDDHGYALALQGDQKIVQAGLADNNGDEDLTAIRYNTNGILDSSFGNGGIVTTNIGPGNHNDQANSIAVQSNGKIVLAGNSLNGDFNIVRYNSNGSPDSSFGGDGIVTADLASGQNDFVRKVVLYSNRIYVAGSVSGAGNRNFGLAAFQNDGFALPVQITHFLAQKQHAGIVLQWQTAGEQNILQFAIQRSSDGCNFVGIGTAEPAKTGSLKKSYSFTDLHPVPATNYYRLLIKEIDGVTKYSKVLAIKCNNAGREMELFPNPVVSTLHVQLPIGVKGKVNLQVTDVAGKIVNTMRLTSSGHAMAIPLDIRNLRKGIYVVKVQATNTHFVRRFLKQ